MHPCAALLQQAFEVVVSEEAALANEDMDAADNLCRQRAVLLSDAWEQRQGFDETVLRERLLTMQEVQARLAAKALDLQDKFQKQQANGRKQARYFNTERHFHKALHKSNYCDFVS